MRVMKYILSLCFIFISSTILYSQDLLSGMHGIKNNTGEILFEVSGYTISVYELKGSVEDAAMIRIVEKSYGLDHILMMYSDSTLKVRNRIIESLIDTPDQPLQISQKCFLLRKDDKTVTVLYLETSMKRNFVLEEEIVRACINDKLSKYITNKKDARSISLGGKKVSLPNGAEWIAPHKILYEDSQISWSEFSSLSGADQYLKNQMAIDKADDIEYIGTDNIKVLFNEIPVTAQRIVYRDPANRTLSNYLIVYYVMVPQSRGYVGCVLSYYDDKRNGFGLPPLLESVMVISTENKQVVVPDQPTKSDLEYLKEEANEEYNAYLLEFQLSSWMPIGNLRSVYKYAPTIGAYLCFPIKQKFGLDVGMQVGLPIESSFEYYDEWTEATSFVGLNLRGRYRGALSRNVVYFSYLGMGVNWLFTDIESGYNEEYDSYDYYKVAALDIFAGFNIRYKKIGGFIEYHYTPYGNSGGMKYNIGHSSVNVGISFAIPYY